MNPLRRTSPSGAGYGSEELQRLEGRLRKEIRDAEVRTVKKVNQFRDELRDLKGVVTNTDSRQLRVRCESMRDSLVGIASALGVERSWEEKSDYDLMDIAAVAATEASGLRERVESESNRVSELDAHVGHLSMLFTELERMELPPSMLFRTSAGADISEPSADKLRAAMRFASDYRVVILLQAVRDVLTDGIHDAADARGGPLAKMDATFAPGSLKSRLELWLERLPAVLDAIGEKLNEESAHAAGGTTAAVPIEGQRFAREFHSRFCTDFVFSSRGWSQCVSPLLTAAEVGAGYLDLTSVPGSPDPLAARDGHRVRLAAEILSSLLGRLDIVPHNLRLGELPDPTLSMSKLEKMGLDDWERGDVIRKAVGPDAFDAALRRMPPNSILDVVTWGCDAGGENDTKSVVVVKSKMSSDVKLATKGIRDTAADDSTDRSDDLES
jgi:hypothetical protein